MDGWVAGSAGPPHPAPLTATGAALHPPPSTDDAASRPPHAAPRAPPPARGALPHLSTVQPPPLGAADTQPVGVYVVETRELMDDLDAALAGGGDGAASSLPAAIARAKAWLDRERCAMPVSKGRPGWRASAAAARPGLTAVVEWWAGGGGGRGDGGADGGEGGAPRPGPPEAVLESYIAAARAARAALDAEDAVEAAGEGGL